MEECRTSARVGVGYWIIDSRSCDATMTGLLRLRQTFMMASCTDGTCSSGIWAPRSPLATMAPSDTRMISSKQFSDSNASIFAKTPIDLYPNSPHVSNNNSHENWEISILMIKKARTRLKLFLQVKERLPDEALQSQEEGRTQMGQTRIEKQ